MREYAKIAYSLITQNSVIGFIDDTNINLIYTKSANSYEQMYENLDNAIEVWNTLLQWAACSILTMVGLRERQ